MCTNTNFNDNTECVGKLVNLIYVDVVYNISLSNRVWISLRFRKSLRQHY